MAHDTEPLQAANIKGLLEEFDAALARASKDYVERPRVLTKRTVMVEVTITPDQTAEVPDEALPEITTEVRCKIPGVRCPRMHGRLDTELGTIMVNPPAVDEETNQTNFDNVMKLERTGGE